MIKQVMRHILIRHIANNMLLKSHKYSINHIVIAMNILKHILI